MKNRIVSAGMVAICLLAVGCSSANKKVSPTPRSIAMLNGQDLPAIAEPPRPPDFDDASGKSRPNYYELRPIGDASQPRPIAEGPRNGPTWGNNLSPY